MYIYGPETPAAWTITLDQVSVFLLFYDQVLFDDERITTIPTPVLDLSLLDERRGEGGHELDTTFPSKIYYMYIMFGLVAYME